MLSAGDLPRLPTHLILWKWDAQQNARGIACNLQATNLGHAALQDKEVYEISSIML